MRGARRAPGPGPAATLGSRGQRGADARQNEESEAAACPWDSVSAQRARGLPPAGPASCVGTARGGGRPPGRPVDTPRARAFLWVVPTRGLPQRGRRRDGAREHGVGGTQARCPRRLRQQARPQEPQWGPRLGDSGPHRPGVPSACSAGAGWGSCPRCDLGVSGTSCPCGGLSGKPPPRGGRRGGRAGPGSAFVFPVSSVARCQPRRCCPPPPLAGRVCGGGGAGSAKAARTPTPRAVEVSSPPSRPAGLHLVTFQASAPPPVLLGASPPLWLPPEACPHGGRAPPSRELWPRWVQALPAGPIRSPPPECTYGVSGATLGGRRPWPLSTESSPAGLSTVQCERHHCG